MTHGITYLPLTDHIIVMKDGQASEQGTYQELLDRKGAFATFLLEQLNSEEEKDEEEKEAKAKDKKEMENGISDKELLRLKRQASTTGTVVSENNPNKKSSLSSCLDLKKTIDFRQRRRGVCGGSKGRRGEGRHETD